MTQGGAIWRISCINPSNINTLCPYKCRKATPWVTGPNGPVCCPCHPREAYQTLRSYRKGPLRRQAGPPDAGHPAEFGLAAARVGAAKAQQQRREGHDRQGARQQAKAEAVAAAKPRDTLASVAATWIERELVKRGRVAKYISGMPIWQITSCR